MVPVTSRSPVPVLPRGCRVSLAAGLAALTMLTPASSAHAHGREPAVGQVVFHPADREHFILRGTWALLTTRDDGESFTWTCAIAAGFDRLSEDPPTVITESNRIALGTFDGLRLSVPGECEYQDGPPETRGAYVIDVQPDPHDPRAIWAILSPGDRENTVLVSRDEGESFEVVGTFEPPADADALPAFVESLRERMVAHLAAMRGRRGAA